MSQTFDYRRGAEDPGLTLPWQEQTAANTWANLDLTSGYTFSLTLELGGEAVVTKTTGITGYDGGVTIEWAAGDLDIAPGTYRLGLRSTTSSRDRDYRPAQPVFIKIVDGPPAAP